MFKRLGIQFLDLLLFSNLFIALCAAAQALVTYHLLKLESNPYIVGFVFCSTLLIYNLSMVLSKPKHPEQSPFRRVRWIFGHYKFIVFITILSFVCLIPLGLFYLGIKSKLLMAFLGGLSLAYNLPLIKLKNKKIGLRNLPGIKLFLIALVWSFSCVLLPITEAESSNPNIHISWITTTLLVVKRFLFVCAITIPFDIRDLFQDKIYELKTIPVILGEKKAWIFCQALLILYIVLLFFFSNKFDLDTIGLSLTVILTGWLIFKSNFKRNEYYYFLFLDGTLLLQYIMLSFTSYIGSVFV
ncbi:UbiA prenyltransferase family protein [Pedobacter montanisoli]|uniref:UbiA prenyltransferase family protein n=1 Tax=Pedobacter montanisoli TaxID=2923277 RepID=A0ABS9ZVA7_9SPHI|nr:hypothetical protein [Pedobacter montanisoli]MCJ0741224.1 hypothetical protein [Pedobacter montanisoli]